MLWNVRLNYIYQYRKMPFMEFDKTLEVTPPPSDILVAIQGLKEQKMNMLEHDKIPPHRLLIDYSNSEIERFEGLIREMKHEKNTNYTSVDDAFRAIMEVVWQ